MARLSIVIPVLRQLDRLEDTLISVLENRPADCQIVVVLNEPYNDPYQLSGEVCFIQAAAGSSFADTLNLGVVASLCRSYTFWRAGPRPRPAGPRKCYGTSTIRRWRSSHRWSWIVFRRGG